MPSTISTSNRMRADIEKALAICDRADIVPGLLDVDWHGATIHAGNITADQAVEAFHASCFPASAIHTTVVEHDGASWCRVTATDSRVTFIADYISARAS